MTSKSSHFHSPLLFPKNFLWGAATSAHQVEGNNIHSDWWRWEGHRKKEFQSGIACDSYNRFEEDFDLAQDLSHNAHRLSIEWARIEPQEGIYDFHEIEHYKKVLKSLKVRGFTVMVTLWHFTLPEWLARKGGFENGNIADYFEKYLKLLVPEISDYVDLWITLNEPQIYAFMSYYIGEWPPQKKNLFALSKVTFNLVKTHKKAYQAIHKIVPSAKVGIAQNNTTFSAFHKHSFRENFTIWLFDLLNNHFFIKMTGLETHDFLGINYYFHRYISLDPREHHRFPTVVDIHKTKKEVTDLGWEIYPQGIFDTIMDFSDYHKPIYITENGLASTNDDRRCRFLIAYLQEIYHAIQTGADVRGYFHWSLLDNFEWTEGFAPRFGLVEVDYKTLKRTPRPSAYVYSDIIKHNGIPHVLLRFLGHTVNARDVLEMDHNCPPELCHPVKSSHQFLQSAHASKFVV